MSATRLVVLCIALSVAGSSPADETTNAGASPTPVPMERARETALALSACPTSVANGAAIYVLEKAGYVKVRDSQNGFTAIVQHSLPNSQEPQCMDAEGTRTILLRILKVAELRAQGSNNAAINRYVADAYGKGIFQPPSRPGIDYMLSTENLVPTADGKSVAPYPPHVMFYAPFLTNADIGSDGNFAGPAFVAGEGAPGALIIVPLGQSHGADHSGH